MQVVAASSRTVSGVLGEVDLSTHCTCCTLLYFFEPRLSSFYNGIILMNRLADAQRPLFAYVRNRTSEDAFDPVLQSDKHTLSRKAYCISLASIHPDQMESRPEPLSSRCLWASSSQHLIRIRISGAGVVMHPSVPPVRTLRVQYQVASYYPKRRGATSDGRNRSRLLSSGAARSSYLPICQDYLAISSADGSHLIITLLGVAGNLVAKASLCKTCSLLLLLFIGLSSAATLGNIHFQDITYHFQIKTCHHNQSATTMPALIINSIVTTKQISMWECPGLLLVPKHSCWGYKRRFTVTD
jgi:hypothetical protein